MYLLFVEVFDESSATGFVLEVWTVSKETAEGIYAVLEEDSNAFAFLKNKDLYGQLWKIKTVSVDGHMIEATG